MLDLLHIPPQFRLNIGIPCEKLYQDQCISSYVEEITWIASLKPAAGNVVAISNETYRYEEIQFFHMKINDTDHLYEISKPVFKEIKYPCVLILQYKEKYMIAVCPFQRGKIDETDNILKSCLFTHWIYPNMLSHDAEQFIQKFNRIFDVLGDLLSVYNSICNLVRNFSLSGITKAHVSRLLYDLCGKNQIPHLLDNCTPYKYVLPSGQSLQAKYQKRNKSSRWFVYRFDKEDVWYSFCKDEHLRRVIENRRYGNMTEMLIRIDEKYDSCSDF